MFFRIDYMLGHRTSLIKFKNNEITPSIFSNHNGIRLKINYKKKTEKHINTQRLNMILKMNGLTI